MIRKTPKLKLKECGYSECENKFIPQRPMQTTCSVSCAIKFNDEKEVKKRVKQMESNVTKLSVYKGLARQTMQRWVRLRDEQLPCISCGTYVTNQWDGGHYYKAELYSGVIFNEINVNKQCCECNGDNMHGNPIEYRKGLIRKYGEAKVMELDVLAIQKKQYSWTRDELIEITNKYKLKIKNGDFSNA